MSICEGKVYFDIFEEINILMRKMKKATELKGCENNIAKFNDLKEIKVRPEIHMSNTTCDDE